MHAASSNHIHISKYLDFQVLKMFTEDHENEDLKLNVYQYSFTSSNTETIKSAFDDLKVCEHRIFTSTDNSNYVTNRTKNTNKQITD